jgi:hypothetical protein
MLILQCHGAPIVADEPGAIPTDDSPQILAICRDLSSRTS